MAGDGMEKVEGMVEGGEMLAGIWCGGIVLARKVGGGRIFVSYSNGLHGNWKGVTVPSGAEGGKIT